MAWTDYFDACSRNDIYAAFEAMSSIGVLPVVNGEDEHGKLKKPMGGSSWQTVTTDQWRDKLVGFLQNGVPVGIGCKPTGYVVIDVDTLDKDTKRLPTAWKEAAQFLFGSNDWPRTMVVRTEGGAHVWFIVTDAILEAWRDRRGKLAVVLPSGDKVEIFVGVPDAGSQVACAPSEGKTISLAEVPIVLPEAAEHAILQAVSRPERPKIDQPQTQANVKSDFEWAKMVLTNGHLDTQLADYDKWLAVGMALSHKFGEDGAELWEQWSARHAKHVDGECFAKVRSFKRTDEEKAVRFGSLIKIATANGAPSPPRTTPEPIPEEFFESLPEAASARDILGLMKERTWLWGDPVKNIGWFVRRGLHLVEGKEGTGKTRWLMDLCRRWSLCLNWPDGSPSSIDQDSKILFVASDSHWDQIAMCAEAFNIDLDNVIFTGPKTDPYGFTNLDDPNTIAMIRHWCDRYKIGLVVIDTLMAASARPLVDPQEVAKIATPLRELAREKNVAVVMVGHLNSQGETWGRAMGRTCDHVIRMEASEADPQAITIKSVKARWNRFELPEICGRQGESGWTYDAVNSEPIPGQGKRSQKEIAKDWVVAYVRRYPGMSRSDIKKECVTETTVGKDTFYTALKELVIDGAVYEVEEKEDYMKYPVHKIYPVTDGPKNDVF